MDLGVERQAHCQDVEAGMVCGLTGVVVKCGGWHGCYSSSRIQRCTVYLGTDRHIKAST